MNRPAARPFRKLAVLGALTIALALSACGLKGGLELPPAASQPPPQAQADGQPTPAPEAETPAPPTRTRIFLDWLLD